METVHYDIKGREIKEGDLLKIWHYKARGGPNVYMYKIVFRVDDFLSPDRNGSHLYAFEVSDMSIPGKSIEKVHKCPLSVLGDCEIVADNYRNPQESFWQRKRNKAAIKDRLNTEH